MNDLNPLTKNKIIGILEWFKPYEYERAEFIINKIKELGVKHIRTNLSWADYVEFGVGDWFDWIVPKLAENFELLPCFDYTPPKWGEKESINSPPRDLKSFADFIDVMISRYGEHFEWIELWNEPNNITEWDWRLDPEWLKFSEMIGNAAHWAQKRGKKTALGGMSPVDPNWLRIIGERGVLKYIDAVGLHGFPGTWDFDWKEWHEVVTRVKNVVYDFNPKAEVWISEAGYSTWRNDEYEQVKMFDKLVNASVDRIYFYSMQDLHPERSHLEGFHADERHYHFGLLKSNNKPKMLFTLWKKGGIKAVKDFSKLIGETMKDHKNFENGNGNGVNRMAGETDGKNGSDILPNNKYILITGGAGFIGTNVADALLTSGKRVMIYDNLARPGVEKNLEWLKKKHGNLLKFEIGDIRNPHTVKKAVKNAEAIYHFAAQVAVTTSLVDPMEDFEINLRGSLNVLEAVRTINKDIPVLFTSTNKVYGGLDDIAIVETDSRYQPYDPQLRRFGFNEYRHLDFHSPYGCSKGGADQYILDYARSYGLKTTLFRMSCIYGPHQFGTEDQGWVAHFIINALSDKDITIFGDGKQVRDILYVKDLVNAMLSAIENIDTIKGKAFNMGGGAENSVSLLEVIELIEEQTGSKINLKFDDWRKGDQKFYVSDTRCFNKYTGWKAKTNFKDGVKKLYEWLDKNKIHEIIKNKELVKQ